MINSTHIIEILNLPDFKNELEELSSFASNIKQERPIVLLFAKYFWRKKRDVILELNKCDLVVDGTRIEFKYHFDCDTTQRVAKELGKAGGELERLLAGKPTGWNVCANIHKDMVEKNPDIFVWIICSRDLSTLDEKSLAKVVWSRQQNDFNKSVAYDPAGNNLLVMNQFLEKLQPVRPFSIGMKSVQTARDFPSTYHFLVCEFGKSE